MSCICGNKIVHSKECLRKNSFEKTYKRRREDRKFLKETHRCYDCKKEVKPKVIYPSRCDCCNQKIRKRSQ